MRAIIDCLQLGGTPEFCEVPNVTTALEIMPFYDVQLTWLSRWNETPINDPLDVTNQAIADNNTHSRGVANAPRDRTFHRRQRCTRATWA